MKKKKLKKLMKNELKDAFKEAFLELGKLYQETEEEDWNYELELKKREIQKLDKLLEHVEKLRKDMDATFETMHELKEEFHQKNKPNYSFVLNNLRAIIEQLDTRLLVAELKLANFFGDETTSHNTTYQSVTHSLEQVKKKVEAEERLALLYSKLADKNAAAIKTSMTTEKAKDIYQSTTKKEKDSLADKAYQELKKKMTNSSDTVSKPQDEKELYEEFDETFEDLKIQLRADDPEKYHELFGDDDEYKL